MEKKSRLTPGAQSLVVAVLEGRIAEADLAAARNSLLGRRPSKKKARASKKNAKKTAGVPRPNARKPASTQAISHSATPPKNNRK